MEDLRKSRFRFELLSKTASLLLVSPDPEGSVHEICMEVMAHLDCQVFFNFLADQKTGRLRLNAYSGIPEEEARKIEWLDYGVAVCGCVARDKSPLIAHRYSSYPGRPDGTGQILWGPGLCLPSDPVPGPAHGHPLFRDQESEFLFVG